MNAVMKCLGKAWKSWLASKPSFTLGDVLDQYKGEAILTTERMENEGKEDKKEAYRTSLKVAIIIKHEQRMSKEEMKWSDQGAKEVEKTKITPIDNWSSSVMVPLWAMLGEVVQGPHSRLEPKESMSLHAHGECLLCHKVCVSF